METLILKTFFGHFIGDFFLQHKMMAENKNQTGSKAFVWCSLHVIVYTITVACFVGNFSPLFLVGVALPHWIGDRLSIAYWWMKILNRAELLGSKNPTSAAFGVVIYVVIDQVYHLGCLYLLLQLLN